MLWLVQGVDVVTVSESAPCYRPAGRAAPLIPGIPGLVTIRALKKEV